MLQKSPSRTTGPFKFLIIMVALIGAAAFIVSVKDHPEMRVRLPSDDDLHENITLSVMFTPQKRTKVVSIQAHVEGVRVVPPTGSPFQYLPVLTGPWNHVIRVPKGASVGLEAIQVEAPVPGNLDCIITVRGKAASHGYRNDAGAVRCFVKSVGG